MALDTIGINLADLAESGLIADPAETSQRIELANSVEAALHGALYVQENGRENLATNQALFRELDRFADPGAVLASSSSALRASLFTEDLAGPARRPLPPPLHTPCPLALVAPQPPPRTAART